MCDVKCALMQNRPMTVEMGKVEMDTVLDFVSRIRIWKDWFQGRLVGIYDILPASALLCRWRITEDTLTPFGLTTCARKSSPTSNLCDSTTLASLRCPSRGELGLCMVATDMASEGITTIFQYSDNILTSGSHTFEQMCGDRTGKGGQEDHDVGLRGDGDALSAGSSSYSRGTGIQSVWRMFLAWLVYSAVILKREPREDGDIPPDVLGIPPAGLCQSPVQFEFELPHCLTRKGT